MVALSHELIEKYAVNGPRYTSYPTAVEFCQNVGSSQWCDHLRHGLSADPAISLYLHVPFCRSLCYFCACHKVISEEESVVGPFLESVQREVAAYRSLLPPSCEVNQIHWGGGSPNFLTDTQTIDLFDIVRSAFRGLAPQAEVSFEADPRTMTVGRLEILKNLGFNRLSFGVQDFNDHVQEIINRYQPFEMVRDLMEASRSCGFGNINVDLIYGLPGQSELSFAATIEQVLALRPNRVALYGYAHVPWLKKVQKKFERVGLPNSRERITLLCRAINLFSQAGYRYIGMDHFALPEDELVQAQERGDLTRNFMGYSVQRAECLIGIGPSSISSLPRCYAQNVKELESYQNLTMRHGLAIERGIERSPEDRMRGAIILDILCHAQIDIAAVEREWRIDFHQHFPHAAAQLRQFEQDGLVTAKDTGYRLTDLGRFFMRNVAMLFDEYLTRHNARPAPVFSQAV